MRRRLIFELRYLRQHTPWDTGISPPELIAHLDRTPPGRALDIGCGTGTNAISIAKRGWKVNAIDISTLAIWTAKRKAARQGVAIDFRRGNILQQRFDESRFDFILDIGCFHSLPPTLRKTYAENLARWIEPSGTFLLYTWIGPDPVSERHLPEMEELRDLFSFAEVIESQQGRDQAGERASAWLMMRPKKT